MIAIQRPIDFKPSAPLELLCQKETLENFDFSKSYNEYQKFLYLIYKYPKSAICPTRYIDHVWHNHMLDPIAYYNDCMKWFGKIIGHDATLGLNEESKKILDKYFENTCELWKKEYQEIYANPNDKAICGKCCEPLR